LILGGVISTLFGSLLAVASMMSTFADAAGELTGGGMLIAMGVGFFAFGAARLPGWARLRRRQMQQLAAMARALTAPED
jgi:hypothetical protein